MKIYVLLEDDYGGTFSSHSWPVGVTTDKEKAEIFKAKESYNGQRSFMEFELDQKEYDPETYLPVDEVVECDLHHSYGIDGPCDCRKIDD